LVAFKSGFLGFMAFYADLYSTFSPPLAAFAPPFSPALQALEFYFWLFVVVVGDFERGFCCPTVPACVVACGLFCSPLFIPPKGENLFFAADGGGFCPLFVSCPLPTAAGFCPLLPAESGLFSLIFSGLT